MKENVIVVSDIHLGYEESNSEDFRDFLDMVYNRKPDVFAIAGDLFEFWRRGMESVMAENADIVSKINDINESNIDTVILIGNHDERFKESRAPEPWNVTREYKFKSGNTEFKIEHGNLYDPANANPAFNERLCLTTDKQGDRLSKTYGMLTLGGPLLRTALNRQPIIDRPSLNTLAHLGNPDILSEDVERANRIDRRAMARNDRFVIMGHTHVPTEKDRYINCGSWTQEENTYVEVNNGSVSLLEY